MLKAVKGLPKKLKGRLGNSIIEYILLVAAISIVATVVIPRINQSTEKRIESSVNILESTDTTVVP